jgi:hypothetical protein
LARFWKLLNPLFALIGAIVGVMRIYEMATGKEFSTLFRKKKDDDASGTSKKQKTFMDAVAHNPAFAKKVGVPKSVGKDFSKASKGMKFGKDRSVATRADRQVQLTSLKPIKVNRNFLKKADLWQQK